MSMQRFRSIKSRACGIVLVSASCWSGLSHAEISPAERLVLGKLDVARAERQIEFLSHIVDNDSGAGAGTATAGMADEEKIARYVEGEFRALGFAVHTEAFPVRHHEHGTVRLVVGGKSIPAISYADGGGTWGTKDGVPYTAGNEGDGHVVRAPVIYVGAGYESDYKRAGDVRGKIVLAAIPGRPTIAILTAALHGAAALLTFSESTADAPRLPDAIAQEPTGYHDQLPTVAISEASGKALRDRIASGHVEATLENRIDSETLSAWDYVLIDAPPALNVLSINILVAADELVIPIEPHPLSLMVLRRLFETITRVRRLNPNLRVHGFLPTKVHHSSRLASDMLTTLSEEFPQYALLPAIPLSVRGAESAAERTSVLHYMPRSPIAEAYRAVGAWLEENDPRQPTAEEEARLHV